MIKHTFSAVILSTVLLASTAVAAGPFSDIAVSHTYFDAINYVKTQGIVSGYPDGSYDSKKTINRAEFTKNVIEAAYAGQASGSECFPDVHDEWFAKYVCFAQSKGIIAGYPDGTFGPTKQLSFSEAAKIIVNAFGYESGSDAIWYKPFVEVLGEKRAIPEAIANFTHPLTRGEMAEMIYRLKSNVTTKKYHSYATLAEGKAALNSSSDTGQSLYTGTILAGTTTPFIDFNQKDFETAQANQKKIVLYFYASWCPVCQEEIAYAYDAFNQLNDDSVVGFRVNYKDSDTDESEVALAREHGIAYQHTKVFLNASGERVKKAPDSWGAQRYLTEIAAFPAE